MSRIGELLVREKMLSLQQLQQAQDEAKRTGKRLGATLARLGYVNDQALTQFVAKQYSLPSINLGEIEIDVAVLKLVPREICEKHQVIPVRRNGPTLIVAMADPSNIYAIDELKFLTQYNIEPVVASESALEAALSRYYDKGPDLDQMIGEFDVLLDVTLEVHRDKGGELDKAGIDLPERALALKRYVVDQIVLEPAQRLAFGEIIDLGRLNAGIDRAGHQGQRRRPRRMVSCSSKAARALCRNS